MKLELIVPATQENIRKRKKALCPPLGLAMVAAVTPPDVEISLTDENVTAIDFQKHIDLVGITVLTVTAQRAYEIADTFRAKGVKVVLGGIHPSVLPEEARQHADAIVIGEAEGVWPKVIEDFKANKLQRVYQQSERPSLVGLPIPRRDLFAKGAYYVRNTLSTTRGCPYSCAFCTVTSFLVIPIAVARWKKSSGKSKHSARRISLPSLTITLLATPSLLRSYFEPLFPTKSSG